MKHIDLQHGEQIFGDKEAAKDLHIQFINQLPDKITNILSTQSNKSYQELQELTHSLRGACCYASTPRLLLALEELDKHSLKLSKQLNVSQEDTQKVHFLCHKLAEVASETIKLSAKELSK